jgi:hypothetical protein
MCVILRDLVAQECRLQVGISTFNSLESRLALAAAVSLVPISASAQSPTVGSAARLADLPRTSDDRPDVQGFWRIASGQIMGTYSIERGQSDEVGLLCVVGNNSPVRGQSFVVDPADVKEPYQAWAAAIRKEVADNYQNAAKLKYIDPQARCYPGGVPRQIYYGTYQILQSPEHIAIMSEPAHQYRVIAMDGRPHAGASIKLWMGDGRGHWEGDTLVVDTTNLNDKTWFDIVGSFHSDALHVVERLTLINADSIRYEATIEDPKVFTRPWKMALPLARVKDAGYELMENACYEGNRAPTNILDAAPKN